MNNILEERESFGVEREREEGKIKGRGKGLGYKGNFWEGGEYKGVIGKDFYIFRDEEGGYGVWRNGGERGGCVKGGGERNGRGMK